MESEEIIRRSQLFGHLATKHPILEVWPDPDHEPDGWSYFWLVSAEGTTTRIVAYLRVRAGQLECRGYDENGDDLWTVVG